MEYFNRYVSNTLASTGNQYYFQSENARTPQTGRVFYKLFCGGTFGYSLLFSNTIDSTYADGANSWANMPCDEWEILQARVQICDGLENENVREEDFSPLTFSGSPQKKVAVGETFYTDEISLTAKKGAYLCLELTFRGKQLPYHEECIVSTYKKDGENWKVDKRMPLPCMIGCTRQVEKRILFWGDSITQGIGTPKDSYLHYAAQVAETLGEKYAYWDIGIGFARASDAASFGAWGYKAKHTDIAVVCFGVNDLGKEKNWETIALHLDRIVTELKKANVKVLLQTVPPFDYNSEKTERWKRINAYIQTTLRQKADGIFDNGEVLQESEAMPQNAKYGGHPNEIGAAAWAKALAPAIGELLRK